ncbi:hypothetical protein TRIHO_42870 [Tritonibacter horizontis]|uniref:Uncharacterized protein n=1 Tax=Tritonibacter horizontis TaxID=1768241 RepID=A0A132BRD0_9RHOB|nr:hypothetical protein TRIHO_42870 [Tritonibacter horizontis]
MAGQSAHFLPLALFEMRLMAPRGTKAHAPLRAPKGHSDDPTL